MICNRVMKRKILFVVHRYYPYAGGSEYYVKNMAEETLLRGHEAWVYTHQHHGDQNGVKVTSDINIILDKFDLIVVHGESSAQNIILNNIEKLKSPVLYMLIKPSLSESSINGIEKAQFLSYSTNFDKLFLEKYASSDRIVYVPHGIPLSIQGRSGFKKKHGIEGNMILSCGGFWKHKGHIELAEVFSAACIDSTLVVTGYWDNSAYRPLDKFNIKTFLIDNPNEIGDAISEADLYVMNSYEEGFGLVLLESMLNRTAWISRPVGKAPELREFGIIYNDEKELCALLKTYHKEFKVQEGYDYVNRNHGISHTVDSILKLI